MVPRIDTQLRQTPIPNRGLDGVSLPPLLFVPGDAAKVGEMALVNHWRTFADATALALGINLWGALVMLPGLAVGGFSGGGVLALGTPLILLGLGVWRRNEIILLFAFPSALLLPIAIAPAMASQQVYGPIRFAIVAIGLVAFLFSASTLTSFYEPPEPHHVRALRSSMSPISARWKRRFRVYAMLAMVSVFFPLTLLYHINFDAAGAAIMSQNYPGRTATFTTLLNVFAIGIWLVVFSKFIFGPLSQHRSGDRALQRSLSRLRRGSGADGMYYYYIGAAVLVIFAGLWALLQN